MTEIIPAIDLIGGKCTRLTRGDYATQKDYGGDPAEWARAFAGCGVRRLHLVDLEGAKSARPENLRTLEAIAALGLPLTLEWGGGVKDDASLASVWNAGADQVVIGSVAVREPQRMRTWLASYGERIILGADLRDGRVAVNGWREEAPLTAETLIAPLLEAGLKRAIVTDISRDGMLGGPSFDLYGALQARFPSLALVVSGGVSSLEDIRRAAGMGLSGVIVGKALYEKRITLKDLSLCLPNG